MTRKQRDILNPSGQVEEIMWTIGKTVRNIRETAENIVWPLLARRTRERISARRGGPGGGL